MANNNSRPRSILEALVGGEPLTEEQEAAAEAEEEERLRKQSSSIIVLLISFSHDGVLISALLLCYSLLIQLGITCAGRNNNKQQQDVAEHHAPTLAAVAGVMEPDEVSCYCFVGRSIQCNRAAHSSAPMLMLCIIINQGTTSGRNRGTGHGRGATGRSTRAMRAAVADGMPALAGDGSPVVADEETQPLQASDDDEARMDAMFGADEDEPAPLDDDDGIGGTYHLFVMVSIIILLLNWN